LERICPPAKYDWMLAVVGNAALAFNAPNCLLSTVPSAPTSAARMSGSMEHTFVYKSAGAFAEPTGHGKAGSQVDWTDPSATRGGVRASLFSNFVYDSAGSFAEPLVDGKGYSPIADKVRTLLPAGTAPTVPRTIDMRRQPPVVTKPVAKNLRRQLPVVTAPAANSFEQTFVYESAGADAAPLGDGKGNSPTDGMRGRVVPTGSLPVANALERKFVYESAGAFAEPLGDGRAN